MSFYTKRTIALSFIIATCLVAQAQFSLDYQAGIVANAGGGDFAPHYVAANRGGTVTQTNSALLQAGLWHEMDTTQRFSYGFGAELWTGYSSSTDYLRYVEPQGMTPQSQHPARFWVQQLFGQLKWRGVFLLIGQKEHETPFLNAELSSGDLIMSGNARPGAGAAAGFVNFQNIPFTRGWVQIAGEMGYYKLGDGHWLENHYNYRNNFVTTRYWYNYKNIYFRTNPSHPFVFTIGGQAACQFGGTVVRYKNGAEVSRTKMDANAKAFFRALIAGSGGGNKGDSFVEGNHVGSWDIIASYRFKNGHQLRAYYQTPWEDGSGIGKMNGFDGLWGVEITTAGPAPVSGVVLEYLDLTNQSGPIHWAPADHENTPLTDKATGNDDYYNNYSYNGYQNHGLSIGSPMVKAPLYNLDGYMRYTDNVMRAFHVGIKGDISREWHYRALASYRKTWGTPNFPRAGSLHDTSMLVEATFTPLRVPGLEARAQFGLDRGTLLGDNTGALLSITYHGNLTFGKK